MQYKGAVTTFRNSVYHEMQLDKPANSAHIRCSQVWNSRMESSSENLKKEKKTF